MLREQIATMHTVNEFRSVVNALKDKFEPYHNGKDLYDPEIMESITNTDDYNLCLPPWICQPYIRMKPDDHIALLAEKQRIADDPERVKTEYYDSHGQPISRKRMKKLRRASRKPDAEHNVLRTKGERQFELCTREEPCLNPMVFS